MQHLEVSGAVRHIYIYVVRQLRVKVCGELERGSSFGLIGIENMLWAGRSGIRIPV